MKVGINIFPLERKNFTGIELYTLRLIEGLVQKNVQVSGYSYTKIRNEIIDSLESYSYLSKRQNPDGLGKFLYNLITINKIIRNDAIYHGTFFSLPYNIKATKNIITVHDFAFKRYPEYFDRKALFFYKLNLDYSLEKADRIICVSNSCYEDLVEFYPTKIAKKGRIVYNGFDMPDFQDENENDFELSKYGRYLLFVGAHHPRKNVENMLKAFSIFSKNNDPYNLVFTGKVDNRIFADFFLKNPHLEKSIFRVGYVSNSLLKKLYSKADLLLLPSIYEGFGFPLLEAMSVGTPVLTSLTSSCGEISGYANEYLVNPLYPDDIAEKLQVLLQKEVREELVRYGYGRARQFSWDKMVEETMKVYFD